MIGVRSGESGFSESPFVICIRILAYVYGQVSKIAYYNAISDFDLLAGS